MEVFGIQVFNWRKLFEGMLDFFDQEILVSTLQASPPWPQKPSKLPKFHPISLMFVLWNRALFGVWDLKFGVSKRIDSTALIPHNCAD